MSARSNTRSILSVILSVGIHVSLVIAMLAIPRLTREKYETVDLSVVQQKKAKPEPEPEPEPEEPEPEPEPEKPKVKKAPPKEKVEEEPPPPPPPRKKRRRRRSKRLHRYSISETIPLRKAAVRGEAGSSSAPRATPSSPRWRAERRNPFAIPNPSRPPRGNPGEREHRPTTGPFPSRICPSVPSPRTDLSPSPRTPSKLAEPTSRDQWSCRSFSTNEVACDGCASSNRRRISSRRRQNARWPKYCGRPPWTKSATP